LIATWPVGVLDWRVPLPDEKKVLNELQLYVENGTELASCDEIQQLNDLLNEACENCDRVFPFAMIEGSSGLGKTQSVFAVDRPCLYIPLVDSSNKQLVYKNFKVISKQFMKAAKIDLEHLQENNDSDAKYEAHEMEESNMSSLVAGVLLACMQYVGDGYTIQNMRHHRFADMSMANKHIRYEEVPVQSVRQWLLSAGIARRQRPVIFLDEFTFNPRDPHSWQIVLRNTIRACGLMTVVLGTNTSVLDLKQSRGSRQASLKELGHAYTASIIADLPSNRLCASDDILQSISDQDNLRSFVAQAIKRGRPLFSRLFIEQMQTATTIDDALRATYESIISRKPVLETHNDGLDGTLALFLPMHRQNIAHTRVQGVLRRHFALLSGGNKTLHYTNRWCEYKEHPASGLKTVLRSVQWTPECHFPSISTEPLLYLLMTGVNGLSPFSDRGYRYITASQAVHNSSSRQRNEVKLANPLALKNDGDVLEAVSMAAICVASHTSIHGTSFSTFLNTFVSHLQPGVHQACTVNLSVYHNECKLPHIPYLFPVQSVKELKDLPTCFQGIFRPRDKERHDLRIVPSGNLTGECKNHERPLDTGVVSANLQRIPRESMVHFVVCRKLKPYDSLFVKTSKTWDNNTVFNFGTPR
jgi:hypothetical protein